MQSLTKYQCIKCGAIYDNYFKIPCKACNSTILNKIANRPVSFSI